VAPVVGLGAGMIGWFWQAIVNAFLDRRERRAKARFGRMLRARLMLIAYHRDERYRLPRFKKGTIL
jgi:hypothetical protein